MRYNEKYVLTLTGTAPNGAPVRIVTEFDDVDDAMDAYDLKSEALPRGRGYKTSLERIMRVEIASTIKA